MYELIGTQYLGHHFLLRQGSPKGVKIPAEKLHELRRAASAELSPVWLTDLALSTWNLDLSLRMLGDVVLVRPESSYGYGRASYELNLGCNYDCEHCYLGLKRFEGLDWPDRERLLLTMRDAGVVWLQLTGGEPLVDRLFKQVYAYAYDLGMLLTISSNGSRLWREDILNLLIERPVYKLTVSVYGATAAGYDKVTKRPGSFQKFAKGLAAAVEAGLPMNLNLVVTHSNAHELDGMKALAEGYGLPYHVYSNISPTIYGGAEVLVAQEPTYLRRRKAFTGCNAGQSFFHADPFGKASICKVGRDPNVPLLEEGVEGLHAWAGSPTASWAARAAAPAAPSKAPAVRVCRWCSSTARRTPTCGFTASTAVSTERSSRMAAVPVVLELPAPVEDTTDPEEITVVDMDDFSTAHKCSCSASDDNPY